MGRIIKVNVPSFFYYIASDCKVSLGKDYIYSYKINATTETNVKMNIECPLTEGEISFRGTKTLYLDDEITLKTNPKEDYLINDWSVIYVDDGTYVEDSILQYSISSDKTECYIKVLTGTEREVLVTPVFTQRGYVTVNFESENGFTTPSEQRKYYVGEKFNISFREIGDFSFTNWKAVDSNGYEVDKIRVIDTGNVDVEGDPIYTIKPALVSFSNNKAIETNCEIVGSGESITIKACCGERPTIIGFLPESLSTVNRDTKIKILFSQSMNESSIYWTKDELKSMNITESNYDLLQAAGKADSNGKQYYYCYREKNNNATKVYKNIEISERNSHINLLQYYGEPFFDTSDNYTLIIPSSGSDNSVPDCSVVEVKISADFKSRENVPVNQKTVKIFQTNTTFTEDTTSPKMKINSFSVLGGNGIGEGTTKEGTAEYVYNNEDVITSVNYTAGANNYFLDAYDGSEIYGMAVCKFPVFKNTGNLTVSLKGELIDPESQPAYLKVLLIPYSTASQVNRTYIETVALNPNSAGKVDFSSTAINFTINMSDKDQGQYKIQIEAVDNANNKTVFDKTCTIMIDNGVKPQVTINNITSNNTLKTTGDSSKYVLGIEIPKDSYYYVQTQENQIFSINGFPNCEYTVYNRVDSSSKQWVTTDKEFNFTEVYNNSYTVSQNSPVRVLGIQVRDVFSRSSTTIPIYVIYDYNTLYISQYEYYTINGRGALLGLSIAGPEEKKISRIYIEANNNQNETSYSIITGVEMNRKLLGGTLGYTYYDFSEPFDVTNGLTVGFILRGLAKTRGNIYCKVKLVDADGIESDWFTCNY